MARRVLIDVGLDQVALDIGGGSLEIAAGTDMDVQEIDGASYNGVDEVRRPG